MWKQKYFLFNSEMKFSAPYPIYSISISIVYQIFIIPQAIGITSWGIWSIRKRLKSKFLTNFHAWHLEHFTFFIISNKSLTTSYFSCQIFVCEDEYAHIYRWIHDAIVFPNLDHAYLCEGLILQKSVLWSSHWVHCMLFSGEFVSMEVMAVSSNPANDLGEHGHYHIYCSFIPTWTFYVNLYSLIFLCRRL